MHCAISGTVPQEPVVSKQSGRLYERRLIVKYLEDHDGREPSGEAVTADDFVALQAAAPLVVPRPANATSLPSLLTFFQSEWDALMLEMFQLKQQHEHTQHELATALYEADAAKRVIARLVMERDAARASLANIQLTLQPAARLPSHAPAASVADATAATPAGRGDRTNDSMMAVDASSPPPASTSDAHAFLPAEADQRIQAAATTLKAVRQARKTPATLAAKTAVASLAPQMSWTALHSASMRGVTALAVAGGTAVDLRHATHPVALSGGKDGSLALLGQGGADAADAAGVVLTTIRPAKKAITTLQWAPNAPNAYLMSADRTVVGVRAEAETDGDGWSLASGHTYGSDVAETASLAVHPCGHYLSIVGGSDASVWNLTDVETAATVCDVPATASGPAARPTSAAAFHPDGQLLGCGLASGTVALWDVRAGTFAVDLADGHASPVTALHFSENGYHLATGARDGTAIEIWDLRKQAIFKTIALDHGGARAGSIAKLGGVRALQFDHAGHYLAAAVGSSVHVYVRKQWDALATLSDIHKPSVTGVQWGPDAQTLYTSGSDRTVIRFAVSSA